MVAGNVAYDYGYYIFTFEEMEEFINKEPTSRIWFRKLIGGRELINNEIRYCLWLKDAALNEIRHIPFIQDRIEKVKAFRLASTKERTRHWANFPTLFSEDRQPTTKYLMFPKVSSRLPSAR